MRVLNWVAFMNSGCWFMQAIWWTIGGKDSNALICALNGITFYILFVTEDQNKERE